MSPLAFRFAAIGSALLHKSIKMATSVLDSPTTAARGLLALCGGGSFDAPAPSAVTPAGFRRVNKKKKPDESDWKVLTAAAGALAKHPRAAKSRAAQSGGSAQFKPLPKVRESCRLRTCTQIQCVHRKSMEHLQTSALTHVVFTRRCP